MLSSTKKSCGVSNGWDSSSSMVWVGDDSRQCRRKVQAACWFSISLLHDGCSKDTQEWDHQIICQRTSEHVHRMVCRERELVFCGSKPLHHASHLRQSSTFSSLLKHLSLKQGNKRILQGYTIPRTVHPLLSQLHSWKVYSNEKKLGKAFRLPCTHHSDCTTVFLADKPPDYRKLMWKSTQVKGY